MNEVTFGQGQLEELAKFTDLQNEIIANLAKSLLSTTKQRNEFAQQLSELQLSQKNIINAFGIKGEGAHSKLVIEHVHGLVAENARAVDAVTVFSKVTEEITEIICDKIGHEKVAEILGAFNDLGNMPNTDAAIAEIKAQGVDELITSIMNETGLSSAWPMEELRAFAANLRAGRKG